MAGYGRASAKEERKAEIYADESDAMHEGPAEHHEMRARQVALP